jgi:hypothetical protein
MSPDTKRVVHGEDVYFRDFAKGKAEHADCAWIRIEKEKAAPQR